MLQMHKSEIKKPMKMHCAVHNPPWSLLITKELDCWVWNNSRTISTIAFEKSTKAFSFPYIFETLDCSIILDVVRILDLHKATWSSWNVELMKISVKTQLHLHRHFQQWICYLQARTKYMRNKSNLGIIRKKTFKIKM